MDGSSKNIVPVMDQSDYFVDQLSINQLFLNGTNYSLVISTRHGVRITLPKGYGTSVKPGYLSVQIIMRSHLTVKTDVDDQYSAGRALPDRDVVAWRKAMGISRDEDRRPQYGRESQASVIHYIDEQDLIDANGSYYVRELDILVTIADGSGRLPPPHPYTRLGAIDTANQEAVSDAESRGSFYALRIVDRRSQFGNRFVNFSGRVCFVKAETVCDDRLDDGVYLTVSKGTNHRSAGVKHETEYFSFSEAKERLPIYQSYEEALTLGNPDEVRKRELEELRYSLEREKIRFNEEQLETKTRLAREEEKIAEKRREHEREITRRRDELEARRMEQDEREFHFRRRETELKTEQLIIKNRLDERSDTRKVWLEVLKFIPAVIGGIITVATAYSKIKESGKGK